MVLISMGGGSAEVVNTFKSQFKHSQAMIFSPFNAADPFYSS